MVAMIDEAGVRGDGETGADAYIRVVGGALPADPRARLEQRRAGADRRGPRPGQAQDHARWLHPGLAPPHPRSRVGRQVAVEPALATSTSQPVGSGSGSAADVGQDADRFRRRASSRRSRLRAPAGPSTQVSSPSPRSQQPTQPQQLAVELEGRPLRAALPVDRQLAVHPGLREPSLGRWGRSRTTGRHPPTGTAPGSRRDRGGCGPSAPRSGPGARRRAARSPRAGRAPRPGRGTPSRAAPASASSRRGHAADPAPRRAAGRSTPMPARGDRAAGPAGSPGARRAGRRRGWRAPTSGRRRTAAPRPATR